MWPFRKQRDDYVCAKEDGVVTAIKEGTVTVGLKCYSNLRCTLVQVGQRVKQGQPLGRKQRRGSA